MNTESPLLQFDGLKIAIAGKKQLPKNCADNYAAII